MEEHPEWQRRPQPLSTFLVEGGPLEREANSKLREAGHPQIILEELLAGRLYTGPMYMKYNAVLRAKSGDPFMVKQYKDLCLGNNYVSTIHAINSCVIKLSKLTIAGKVWRGVCYGKLPQQFWTPSSDCLLYTSDAADE